MSKAEEVLSVALDKLKRELEKEPLSPDRVSALAETIKVLAQMTLEQRVEQLEKEVAELREAAQPENVMNHLKNELAKHGVPIYDPERDLAQTRGINIVINHLETASTHDTPQE